MHPARATRLPAGKNALRSTPRPRKSVTRNAYALPLQRGAMLPAESFALLGLTQGSVSAFDVRRAYRRRALSAHMLSCVITFTQ